MRLPTAHILAAALLLSPTGPGLCTPRDYAVLVKGTVRDTSDRPLQQLPVVVTVVEEDCANERVRARGEVRSNALGDYQTPLELGRGLGRYCAIVRAKV